MLGAMKAQMRFMGSRRRHPSTSARAPTQNHEGKET
jgi:hypothetical protein